MRTNSRTSDLDTSIPAAAVWSLGGDYIRDVSHVVSRMLSHMNICTAITRLLQLQVHDRSWAQLQVSCVTVVLREALHGTQGHSTEHSLKALSNNVTFHSSDHSFYCSLAIFWHCVLFCTGFYSFKRKFYVVLETSDYTCYILTLDPGSGGVLLAAGDNHHVCSLHQPVRVSWTQQLTQARLPLAGHRQDGMSPSHWSTLGSRIRLY